MNNSKSLYDRIFSFNEWEFDALALELFMLQAHENEVYSRYVRHLGVIPEEVKEVSQIPFLPIEFFKSHKIQTGEWTHHGVFESSGTTGDNTSRHYFPDLEVYLQNCTSIFSQIYGDPKNYIWLALLPSYLERSGSGLVTMMDHFIGLSDNDMSGFYLDNHHELIDQLNQLKKQNSKVILLGVTFGLLDLAENAQVDFSDLIVMETGGMKGRREELVRGEVHSVLKEAFGVSHVHSEYGMTELFSQAYSQGEGVFSPGRTMKVLARDLNDPLTIREDSRNGGLNIIDLANLHSCAFIETKDIGRVYDNGAFEVLGRMDNSDVRGCNLLLA